MPSHKITEIVGQKLWEKDDIKVVFWTVKCEGLDKPVNFGRKPGNEPKVGDTLDGDFTDDGKQFKFKKANNGRPGMSPEQQKAIVRQHSQEMALRREANLIAGGKGPLEGEQLKALIDWFTKDANA